MTAESAPGPGSGPSPGSGPASGAASTSASGVGTASEGEPRSAPASASGVGAGVGASSAEGTAVTNGLVIGAMKSGTTTLYHDLRRVPGLSIPAKELDFFQRPVAEATRANYDEIFADHEAGSSSVLPSAVRCRVDISTTYTMWPDVADVPERAAELLDGTARLVYLVRDPVDRAVSHHHHMVARGATSADFAQYLRDDPGVIGFGRYDLQAKRWTDLFGQDALLVVRLDDYSSDWAATAPKILAHLLAGENAPGRDQNLDPDSDQNSDPSFDPFFDIVSLGEPARENASAEAKVFTGRSRQIAESPLFGAIYRNGIRRIMSESVRTKLRNLILPAPPERPPGPDLAVLQGLAEQLKPAADWVAEMTQTEPWDLMATAVRLAGGRLAEGRLADGA